MQYDRIKKIIPAEELTKIQNNHIYIFGLGGVGSYVIEGLVRSGIGHLVVVDNDIVDVTNINRQLIADTTTIGKVKVEVIKERVLKINPNIDITIFKEFHFIHI